MKVFEYICECREKMAKERIKRLIDIDAPLIVVEKTLESLKRARAQEIGKVGGDVELLQEEFESREIKKGRGGKEYLVINGHINFFPMAKYGSFIKEASK